MPGRRPDGGNIAVEHGRWGEDIAVSSLRRRGFEIIERNSRPCKYDRRLEIDIIAYDRRNDVMVFVEVKQHSSKSEWQRRMRSVNKRKLMNLRRACNAWKWENAYKGGFRFDVIEIYGEPGRGSPEVDHIERVCLFERPQRFVRWTDGDETKGKTK